jgi:hypothetical protein
MFGHQLILKALLHVGGMWWLGGGVPLQLHC